MMKRYVYLSLVLFTLNLGCKKFLDERPTKKLAIASTLQDLQALMDQYYNVNQLDVGAGEACSDDYYVTDADWARQSEAERRLYVWEKDFVFAPKINDWFNTYQPLYRFNTVLETVDNIDVKPSEFAIRDNVKGQAYFLRGRVFLLALQLWGKAYDANTAGTDLGIPLRLGVNFNEPSSRASVAAGYVQVVDDFKKAIRLLPNVPVHVMRAAKPAAYALLARTYLAMNDYGNAYLYADSCMKLKNTLIDYATLNANAAFPLAPFNTEVLFSATMGVPTIVLNVYAKVNPDLYNSYEANDLRKNILFRKNADNSYFYRGSYDGSAYPFTGVSTNEVYLMRAECLARANRLVEARADLNTLLRKRYNSTFVDVTENDGTKLLARILSERRKELTMRGLRWMDLRRLNKLGANIELQRTVNGKTYTLSANGNRFTLTIPEDVISSTGMPQND